MVIRRLIQALLLTAGFLALAEGILRFVIDQSDFFGQAVEISAPHVLQTKLDALHSVRGTKLAMLGDSLVYGHAMAEAGDLDWREHSLPQLVRSSLERKGINPSYVGNFGMNGLLPADIERLLPALIATGPDIVLFDLTLRSYSRDFAEPKAQYSRPWIRNLAPLPEVRKVDLSAKDGVASTAFGDTYIFKAREFVLSRLFDGTVKDAVTSLRTKYGSRDIQSGGEVLPPEFLLTMRAKKRYANIDLDEDNPQWQALDRLLTQLAERRQRTLIFYATENPAILPDLMDPTIHAELIARLERRIIIRGRGCVLFVPPQPMLVSEDFIDHVHLNFQGNRKLAEELVAKVRPLLAKPC